MATRLIAFSLLTALAAAQLPGLTGLPTSVAPGLPGFGLPGIQGTNVNQKDRIVAITGNVAAVMTSLGTSIVAPNIDMPTKNIISGAITSLKKVLEDLNQLNTENGAIPVPEPIIPGVSSAPAIPGLPGLPAPGVPGQLPGFGAQPLGINNGIGSGVIGQ